MLDIAMFVDGSNLFGALKSMNLEVQDYEALYGYLLQEAQSTWHSASHSTSKEAVRLHRVYWYVVGHMDDWDLSLPQSQTALQTAFANDKDTHDSWLAKTGKADPSLRGKALEDKAWAECFADFKTWYERKWDTLNGMRRFHQSIRIHTDLIDVVECGHWKVHFLQKYVEEKGLDTTLAVDMVALKDCYDLAVVISGDADSIPSIHHCKRNGKHVAAVEFINGSPPEQKGRSFSSRLKEHADFVVRVYETELVRHKIAARPKPRPAGT